MIYKLLSQIPESAWAILMAAVLSFARAYKENPDTSALSATLEVIICCGLAVAAGSVISALELSQHYHMAASVAIAVTGSKAIRELAIMIAKKKVN